MKGFLYGQTEYNILASTTKLEAYLNKAKEHQFDFISITDSNLHGSYKFYTMAKSLGMKPILGLEYTYKDEDQGYSKALLYAKNTLGYQNLLKISSKVKIEGIETMRDIYDFLDGIDVIYVFDDSFLERLFKKKAMDILAEYLGDIHYRNFYIGISYINKPTNLPILRGFIELSKRFGISLIPLHHMKYLEVEDSIVYTRLTEIAGNKDTIGEFDDYSFLEEPEESKELNAFVEKINYTLYEDVVELPTYPNTKGKESSEFLAALCHKGLERRGVYTNVYIERLEYELSIIHSMGYDDYFLIVWDFIKYSKQNNILVGPGRGSAAGSLVAYCLGITEVDPLKYGLLFERFLNPERVTMPDIDTDFPDIYRADVIEHVKELYGSDHVCSITAFGTFRSKSAVRDLAKLYKIEKNRLDKIVDMLETKSFKELKEEYRGTELEEFFFVADKLDGLPKNISTHAAGIILSKKPLDSIVPMAQGQGLLQSQYEACDLEKIGLLKMDFLGISNLTMIAGMMRDSGFDYEKLRNIPLDDKKVYSILQNGDTLGIFQMEKSGFQKVLRELKPTCFNDIVAVLALYRPGPMDSIPVYIKGKHEGNVVYLHKDLEPILKETYGVIVYQEQIMKIAQVFAGYSLGEADLLRRAVSKKDSTKLQALSNDFITKSIGRGYSHDIAESIYQLIYKFADYGFNKSHSVAYALFAYQMLYFKANHFNAFMSNIMDSAKSSRDTLVKYIAYAKKRGLITQKPNINLSTNHFVFIKNWLYLPLDSVLSIGENITLQLVEEREKNGLYRSFEEFLERTKSFLSKSNLEALVYSGALDVFHMSKKSMTERNSQQQSFMKFISNPVVSTEEYDFDYLREKEKEYIGINIEYNPFRNSEELYPKYNALPISKIILGQYVSILAVFTDMKEIKTKKGEYMMLGSLEDEISTLRFTIFPKTYKEIPSNVLRRGVLYRIYGVLDKDNHDEKCFSIQSIELLQ